MAHSQATKDKIRAKALGRPVSEITRLKMGESHRGAKHSVETRAQMSASAQVAQKARRARDMATPEGRRAVIEHMRMMSRVGYGTDAYRESKRAAALTRYR